MTLSVCLVLYVAVFGALGLIVQYIQPTFAGCAPTAVMWGFIDPNCESGLLNLIFEMTVGAARTILVFPSLAFAGIKAGIINIEWNYAGNALPFALFSFPLIFAAVVGIRTLRRRSRLLSTMTALTLLTEVGILGWSM